MTLRAGDRLGPYEIVAPLGAGGMGEVYKARDTRLGRDVAIKVLPAHLSANPELRARFEREARAISQLNHPRICSLHDIGSQDGVDYLVMEHLEGETLAGRLAKGPLPLIDVLRYGSEIASALDCAHRSGIVHRDLKPGNIMLTKGGARLMDFGLARPMRLSPVAGALSGSPTGSRPITAEGTIVGTFQYMAPEQLEGKETDARTDLWALGCVLYEMATGERPFEGTSQASLIAAILKEQPRPILEVQPMVPAVLRAIVARCLEKQPEERFQSARDLGFALETLGGSGPPGAGSAGMLPSRGPRRVPPLAVGSVLGAAIIFLAVALAWWQQWPPFQVPAQPRYERITFRQGSVTAARFTPVGREALYSAAWEEGIYFDAFMPPKASPDGTVFLARSKDGMVIVPLRERGVEPRLVKGLEVGEKVVSWCADSRKLYVVRWGPFPIQVWALDPDTGQREKARTIDPRGYHGPSAENILLTPDGKRGAMMTRLWHSELYVVSGLR